MMKTHFISLLVLGTLTSFHSAQALTLSKLAYMVEKSNGEKQIAVADADGKNEAFITSGSLWHLYPSFSADGKSVTYLEGPDADHLTIVTQDLATGNTEQWTKSDSLSFHPRVSKNGKWLAYSTKTATGKFQIAVIHLEITRKQAARSSIADGSRTRTVYETNPKVIPSAFSSYFPAIASDGSFLIFQQDRSKTERELVEVYLEDGSQTPLPSPPSSNCMAPSLSFDDQKVAFTCKVDYLRKPNWEIFTYDRTSKSFHRITENPAQDFAPTFSPVGKGIYFSSDRPHPYTGMNTFQLYFATGRSGYLYLTKGEDARYAPSFSGETRPVQNTFPEMLAPSRSSFGAVKVGRRIYVIGGHQGQEHTYPESSFSARNEAFDLDTQKWIPLAPRSVPAQGFGVASFGKYLYVFGGFAFNPQAKPHWRSLDTIERYDTELNTWQVIAKLPRARSSNVVAQVGTTVYLMGGWDATPKFPGDLDGNFLSQIDTFDLLTETSSTLAVEIPDPKRRALSGVVYEDEIILIGGLGQGASHFELLDQVTAFNVKTLKFRELAKLPYPTFAPAAGVLTSFSELFLFGGMFKYSATDAGYVNHIYRLSLLSGSHTPDWTWQHTGRTLKDEKSFAQVVELDSATLGILGGHSNTGGNAPVLTFESYGY